MGSSFTIDHSKFTVLQDGGLQVETSVGTKLLTRQPNSRYFNERPGISDKDYHSTLGVSKKEYLKLVRSRNEKLRNFDQIRAIENVRQAKTVEFANPAFDDDDAPLIPTPENASPEWQKQPLTVKMKSALSDVVSTLSGNVNQLLSRFKPGEYQRLSEDDDVLEMEDLTPQQITETGEELEMMRGRLQELGPQFGPLIDDLNVIAREYHDEEDDEKRNQLDKAFADKKAELDTKLDELDKIRERKNAILKLVGISVATTGVAGALTGIFEAIANALGSDTAKDLLPKSTDPKDIAESGIGKMIKKKLEDLAAYFRDRYLNSSGTAKAFWHMMKNTVEYLQDHLWLIIATAIAILVYEINKKR